MVVGGVGLRGALEYGKIPAPSLELLENGESPGWHRSQIFVANLVTEDMGPRSIQDRFGVAVRGVRCARSPYPS